MNNTSRTMQNLKDYIWLSVASLLIAMAVKMYLVPCHIVTGSVSGLALLVSEIIKLNDSLIVLLMNILCLVIGVICLGKKFGVRCVYISILLPLLMELIPENTRLLSGNILVNIFAFLMLLTPGQCIMLAMDTTSGGLDTIAEVLARKLKVSTGLMIAATGIAVSLLTISVYGLQIALMGALVTLANGLMINGFDLICRMLLRSGKQTSKAHA